MTCIPDRHSDQGEPKRELLLANEVEKASPIVGVHRRQWTGAAFQDGDLIVVENGAVMHKKLQQRRVPIAYGFKPLHLCTLPNARSSTIELVGVNGAKRVRGEGGVVMGHEPLTFINGSAQFEVVIKRYEDVSKVRRPEGIEVGVTTTPPQSIDLSSSHGYVASVRPNWSSDDSGSLCINGVYYDGEPGNGPNEGQWSTTRPIELKRGDVVLVTVYVSGALEIHVNGVHQVRWEAAQIPTNGGSTPLYALASMRAPAVAIALRQKEGDLRYLPGGARTVTLRGIEGRVGEIIDLSKHGRPKYPAAFFNVRRVSDSEPHLQTRTHTHARSPQLGVNVRRLHTCAQSTACTPSCTRFREGEPMGTRRRSPFY